MLWLPPDHLRATLTAEAFDLRNMPDVSIGHADPRTPVAESRRRFLKTAAGLVLGAGALSVQGAPLVFDLEKRSSPEAEPAEGVIQLDQGNANRSAQAMPRLALGEIPADFWERPRELHLQREATNERIKAVYWRDGKLVPEGYWAICNLLRDVRAKMMTYMDPASMDILRGILGYYEAWNWNYPIIIMSGYRTPATNAALSKEGAAKNSMHLYGKAVDLRMQGIPVAHLAQLGLHFQRGGVGFYPQRGFVHLDTGRIRSWRG